jgi:hypothetical protein
VYDIIAALGSELVSQYYTDSSHNHLDVIGDNLIIERSYLELQGSVCQGMPELGACVQNRHNWFIETPLPGLFWIVFLSLPFLILASWLFPGDPAFTFPLELEFGLSEGLRASGARGATFLSPMRPGRQHRQIS